MKPTALRRTVLALLLLGAATAARAQSPAGFALQTFEPAPAGDRFFTVAGTDVDGHLVPAAALVLSWAKDPLVLRRDGHAVPGGKLVSSELWGFAQGSLSIGRLVLVDVAVPVALSQSGDQPFPDLARVSTSAFGDVKLGARVPLVNLGVARLAAAVDLWLPTGARGGFTSDGSVRGRPKLVVGGDLPVLPVSWGGEVGLLVREGKDLAYTRTGSAVSYSAAAAWRAGALRIGPELYGRYQFSGTATSPQEALLGATWTWQAFELGAAVGTAFDDSPGAAPLRVIARLAWKPGAAPPPPKPAAAPAPPPRPAPRPVPTEVPLPPPPKLKPAPPPPPPDRDADGIPDAVDACPDVAGLPSDDPAKNGCPGLAKVTGERIEILQQIQFENDRDVLRPESEAVLRDVAAVLAAHPEIAKVRIEGHTDSKGNAGYNTVLSERRALAVRRWLVEHGIAGERLLAKGFGPTRPIADNDTAEGRARNRRVEFRIE
jgi:outer membrane protein OmpA-like peptidoglycan-associated protein